MMLKRLARLGVHLMIIYDGGVKVRNRLESSLVAKVKENQYTNLYFWNSRVQYIYRKYNIVPKSLWCSSLLGSTMCS